jgi:hypothetical protein
MEAQRGAYNSLPGHLSVGQPRLPAPPLPPGMMSVSHAGKSRTRPRTAPIQRRPTSETQAQPAASSMTTVDQDPKLAPSEDPRDQPKNSRD